MPAYIVKHVPDADWYVSWSTIVDGPTAWGDRAELAEYLTLADGPTAAADQRFDRADANGSSSFDPFYRWDCGDLIVYTKPDGKGGGPWWLKRADIREFCERFERSEPVKDLLTKIKEGT